MFMMSQPIEQFPPLYDPDLFTTNSFKMHVPDHIDIVGDAGNRWSRRITADTYEYFAPMNVPEKIIILGQNQSVGVTEGPNLHLDLVSLPSNNEPPNLSTPPRILTLDDHPFLEADDDGEDVINDNESSHFGKHSKKIDKSAFDGFRSQFSKYKQDREVAVIRHHLSGLSQKITTLEKENLWRSRREMILYPFLLGYVLFQVVRWAVKQ